MTFTSVTMRFLAAMVGVWIALSALAMIGGCASRPVAKRQPAVTTPTAFRGAGGAAARTPADAASLADLKWFEVLKDERLHELIRTALVPNYDLREAVVRVEAARAAVGSYAGRSLPDHRSWRARHDDEEPGEPIVSAAGGGRSDADVRTVAANLLSFELDLWGRLRRATESARAELLASEENRKAVATTLVSDVAAAYFTLLELDMELQIARRTLAVRRDSLVLIRNRERGGLGTLLDVRQGEQLVQAAEQVIPGIEQLISQIENEIALLIGDNPGPVIRGRPLTCQEPLPQVPPGMPSALLTRRPDIRAAEQTLASSSALVDVARAAYLPRISLTSLLGVQSDQLSSLFTGPARVRQFVPQVTQPVFQRRPHPIECAVREGAGGDRADSIRADHPDGVSRSLGRARAIREGARNPHDAGGAGGDAARSIAAVVHPLRRRHRYAAERARRRSRSVRRRARVRASAAQRTARARPALSRAPAAAGNNRRPSSQ